MRWVGMAVALLTLYLLAPDRFDGSTLAMVAFLGLSLDLRNPLSLRNYFLVYTGTLLLLGGLLYPDLPIYPLDATLFMGAFMLGYVTYRWTTARRSGENRELDDDLTGRIRHSLEGLLWITAGLQVVRLAILINQYGVAGFFSGKELVSRFESFTESNSTAGVIIHIALTALIAAASALYFEHCLQTRVRPNFKLLGLSLIVLPALSLQRFSLILNSLLMAAIYACYKRAFGRPTARRSSGMKRYLPVALLLAVSVGLALKIGNIRAESLNSGLTASGDATAAVLKSEFTPVLFYKNAKDNIDVLGYRYGGNIVGALVTRLIPRTIWKDKPITTAEFYAREIAPDALNRGFVLAPSVFGVSFLNFGLAGTAVLMALFGVAGAYFDRGYIESLYSRIPDFLLVTTWTFSLLRDDLATSLISVLLTFGLYKLFRAAFVRLSDRSYSPAGWGA